MNNNMDILVACVMTALMFLLPASMIWLLGPQALWEWYMVIGSITTGVFGAATGIAMDCFHRADKLRQDRGWMAPAIICCAFLWLEFSILIPLYLPSLAGVEVKTIEVVATIGVTSVAFLAGALAGALLLKIKRGRSTRTDRTA